MQLIISGSLRCLIENVFFELAFKKTIEMGVNRSRDELKFKRGTTGFPLLPLQCKERKGMMGNTQNV